MTTVLHTRVAWQTPSLTVWSQSTVFIHTSTAGVLDSHKDLNQQKMGIPPMTLKTQCLDRVRKQDILYKAKKERDCGFLVEFSLVSGGILFSPDEEHFNKKISISFINTMKWHSLETALTHICLTKNICFFSCTFTSE